MSNEKICAYLREARLHDLWEMALERRKERAAAGNFNANSTEGKEWKTVGKDEAGTALLMRKV